MDGAPTIRAEEKNGKWKLVLCNFRQLDARIGRDVLTAFGQCFVHADRLNSTVSCTYASMQHHGPDSIAHLRDIDALAWFTIGTLYELADSIRSLRTSLHDRGLLDPTSDAWIQLNEFQKRLNHNKLYQRTRNKAAFHVDPSIIRAGMEELARKQHVTLIEGVGTENVRTRLPLGFHALHYGLGLKSEDFRKFLKAVTEDNLAVGQAVQQTFISTAEKAGVPVKPTS